MAAAPSFIGVGTFLAVKFIGYSYAGHRLNKAYGPSYSTDIFGFGLARTLLGVVSAVTLVALSVRQLDKASTPQWGFFLILFFLLRMAEWAALIWYCYERKYQAFEAKRLLRYSLHGSIWSYLLDIPALLSMIVVPGGLVGIC